jgi:hypothetical protein
MKVADGRNDPTAASREEPAGLLGGPLAGERTRRLYQR